MNDQDKIRAARAAYAREYRKKHPEKIKAAQDRYWLKRLEQKTPAEEAKDEGNDEQKGG